MEAGLQNGTSETRTWALRRALEIPIRLARVIPRRPWNQLAAALALFCPATAHAHGGEQLLVAWLMIVVAVVTIPLVVYAVFHTVFAMLRRVGLVRIPKEWALGACLLMFVTVLVAPNLLLPLPLRVRIAAMNRLFPGFRLTGFRQSDVPGLIDILVSDGDFDAQFTAGRVLSDLNAPVVTLLIARLDSPDVSERGNAMSELESTGAPARAAIPRVIRILAEEADSDLRQHALSFLTNAAKWGDRQRWTAEALPVVITLLRETDNTADWAAIAIGAMKADGAPALPALREALHSQRVAAVRDSHFEMVLSKAITSICSSIGSNARDNPDCSEQFAPEPRSTRPRGRNHNEAILLVVGKGLEDRGKW